MRRPDHSRQVPATTPTGVSLTVSQTEPGRRETSSLSDGDLVTRISVLGRGRTPVRARPKKYPDELVARGVRLALGSGRPIAHVAADLGMHPETLRKRVRQAQADGGGH